MVSWDDVMTLQKEIKFLMEEFARVDEQRNVLDDQITEKRILLKKYLTELGLDVV